MEMEEQDRHLEKVGETVGTLKMLGQGIGRELDEQNVYVCMGGAVRVGCNPRGACLYRDCRWMVGQSKFSLCTSLHFGAPWFAVFLRGECLYRFWMHCVHVI
jgi:hypothetical protein